MLRLIAYAVLGYVAYELYRGMTQPARDSSAGRFNDDLHSALNRDAGRMSMTGPGRGQRLASEDDSGASASHVVGRGVV